MRTKEEIKEEIADLKVDIDAYEIDPDDEDVIKMYDDMLDEVSDCKVGNMEFDGSRVLKEIDPTAYRVGMTDFIDTLDKDDFEDYREMTDELENLEGELEDLEDKTNLNKYGKVW